MEHGGLITPLLNNMDLSRKLYPAEMQRLAQVIAEVSEKSFRRGWQQGIHCAENSGDYFDPANLRYSIRASWSPHPETGKGGTPSVDRLHLEEAEFLSRQAGITFAPTLDRMLDD
jgi:hypothetical protein